MVATTLSEANATTEVLRSLSRESKGKVLFALLRELIALHGATGLIPLVTPEGESLGYYAPPEVQKSLYEKLVSEMPESVLAKMTQPFPDDFDADDCLSEQELEALKQSQ